MSGLQDNITELQKEGIPDDQILNAVKSYKPELTPHIDDLMKDGKVTATQALQAVRDYDAAETKPSNTAAQAVGMAAKAANDLGGVAKTVDVIAGTNLAPSVDSMTQGAIPNDYQPVDIASKLPANNWRSVGKWLVDHNNWSDVAAGARNLGQMAVENSPSIAASGAGAAAGAAAGSAVLPGPGTVVGGLIGAGLGYGSLHFGRDAQAAANAREGVKEGPDAPITKEDMVRAGVNDVIQGNLMRAGLSPAGMSARTLPQFAGQVGKGAIIGAAAGGASPVAEGALIEGKVDPSQVAAGAVAGAAGGAAARVAAGVRDISAHNLAKRYNIDDIPAKSTAAQEVARDLAAEGVGSRADSRQAIASKSIEYKADALELLNNIKTELKAAGKTPETKSIGIIQQKLSTKSAALSPRDFDTLESLGGQDAVNVAARLEAIKAFDKAQRVIGFSERRDLNKLENMASIGLGLGHSVMTGDVTGLASGLALKVGTDIAQRGVDAVTGRRNPVQLLVNRYNQGVPGSVIPVEQPQQLPPMVQDAPSPLPQAPVDVPRQMPDLVGQARAKQIVERQLVRPQGPAPEMSVPAQGQAIKTFEQVRAPEVLQAARSPIAEAASARPEGITLQSAAGERFQPMADIFNSPEMYKRGYEQRNASRSTSWDALQELPDISPEGKQYFASIREQALKTAHGHNNQATGMKAVAKVLHGVTKTGKRGRADFKAALKHLRTKTYGGHSFRTSWKRKK